MKKRVLSAFMALALCLTLLPAAAWAEEADTPEDGMPVVSDQAGTNEDENGAEDGQQDTDTPEAEVADPDEEDVPQNGEDGETSGNVGVQSEETEVEPLQLYANDEGGANLPLLGSGTAEDPYLITSVADLETYRDAVKGGEATICARLMSDLDLGEVTDWTPIEYHWSGYCGIFDGNNYTIKASKWTTGQGLFGAIDGGTVKNLNFTVKGVTAIDGGSLLCNKNYGTIEQCTVTAFITDNKVTESGSFGVFAGTNKIGPLDNEKGLIKNCLAVLMSDFRDVCGFAVTNDGTIENSLCAIVETNVPNIKSVYAIAKTLTNKGTSENCYCTLYNVSLSESLDSNLVTTSYLDRDEAKRAECIKQIAWKLNNGKTDPWRYGGDVGFNSDYYPTLNPTDAKVTESDGSETVTPHTHRVDGVIREFVAADSAFNDGEYIYLSKGQSIVDGWNPKTNKTVCLNGCNLYMIATPIVVQEDITFTLTDCQGTGEITSENSTGVTVNGGTFVLDNVSVTDCATGIDFQSGTVKLSGSAKVTDNAANIKLAEGQKLTFGLLDETARFGVTYDGSIVEGGEVEITDETGAEYAAQLLSDKETYVTGLNSAGDAVALKYPEPHIHCICGAGHKEISGTADDGTKTGHTTEESVTFKPWNPNSHRDGENRPTLPTNKGSYYLTEDANLGTGFWEPDGEVKLCLNGHTVTFDYRTNDNKVALEGVRIDDENDHVTVTDCSRTPGTITLRGDKKQSGVRISNGATFNLYAGTMKGFARAVTIGDEGTQHTAEGTFNLYGGTLTENVNNVGPAVYANGSNANVTMYSGTITNNKIASDKGLSRRGGGVCVEGNGSFTMYGGEISNNGKADPNAAENEKYGAAFGGGVYVSGAFRMTGGKITGNTVTPFYERTLTDNVLHYRLLKAYGGGVYVSGTFKMTGGEITNNTLTRGHGGGVYISGDSRSEPVVIENAIISGNAVTASKEYSDVGETYYYGGTGGGIYSGPNLTLKSSKIENNSLTNAAKDAGDQCYYGGGAGVYIKRSSGMLIENCTISGNTLTGRNTQTDSYNNPRGAIGGAGVCVPSGNLTIQDSEITGNTAISDADAAGGRELVGGGVLFCDSSTMFTVSGTVKISGNTVDGADGNVYLEKIPSTNRYQTKITAGALGSESNIGVMARTAGNSDVQVAQASGDSITIPSGVFTSDSKTYKAVLSDDGKSVTLTVNTDVAEVIHSDGTTTTTTGYSSLSDALAEAESGDTVKVLKDCDLSDAVTLNDITLELNGKTVTATVTATVEAKAAISLSEPATIQNGIINGTVSGGSALILCQGGSLKLKDVTITESAAQQAVAIVQGSLFMDSGTIDGGLQIGAQASLVELSGGTFQKANGPAITGPAVTGGLSSYLKSGYAYQVDGQLVDLSKKTETENGKPVTVVKCENHAFEQGKCQYCNYVCKHETVDEDSRKCSGCGAIMAARVRMNPSSSFDPPIYVWYLTLEEAFASIKPEDGLRQVYYYNDQTLTGNVEISGNVICYAMNRARLSFESGKSFVVKNGGCLQLQGRGYTGAVTVESGGEFIIQEKDNSVGTLTVYDGSKLFSGRKLTDGHFDKIVIADGDKTLADLLPSTSTLWRDDKSWVTDEELSGKTIESVTVVQKPFYGETLTIASETQEYAGSNEAVMRVTFQKEPSGSATYTWYGVYYDANGRQEHKITETSAPTYTEDISGTGTYTYVCYVACDGYTRRTNEIDCKITPATAKYTTEPTANTLTYNGSAQELVTAGTTNGGTIKYSLDQTDWSTEVPKASQVGSYTVYCKIEGDDNHTDSEVKRIDVKIDPLPVEITWSGTENLKYDGNAKTVTASVSNLVNGENVTLTLTGVTATDAGSHTATVTALGGTDAGNYTLTDGQNVEKVWTIAKANDNEITGLTINDRTYGDTPNTPTATAKYGTPTFQYSDAENGTYENIVPTDAGTYWVKAVVAETTNYNAAKSDPVQFTISKKDITGATVGAFDLTYTGKEQQPAATVTIDGLTVTGVWTGVTDVAAKTTFTATGNFTGKIENVETGMKPKDLSDAEITLFSELTYNGQEQKQNIMVKLAGFTNPTFTVSGNTATDVKADGNYMLTITGTGNFGGTKTQEWNIAPIAPTKNSAKETTATVRRGRALSSASITKGEWFALDGVTVLDGTYSWADGSQVMDADGNAQIVFHPASANYSDVTFEVAVTTYVSSGGGGGSSQTTYPVTAPTDVKNGTVSVSPSTAKKGDTVTITVTPDKGYTLETVTAADKDGKELKLTSKGDGKYTFTMPASKVTVKTTFMDDNTMLNYFVDVKASDYFYDAVLWAAEKGVTSGTDATHFSPNAPCTRAQIVTFLWRAAGSPEPKGTGSFVDVPADSYYAKAVTWAMENGITGGTGDGKFSPNATCTREQAVTFLYRASGSPAVSGGSAFRDVAADAYYADAVAWAEKNGVTGGIGGGLFGSGNDCTRAQIVTFLHRSYLSK